MLLVTGANGQLGHCLRDILKEKDAIFTDVADLDITDSEAVFNFATQHPGITGIINCAAYTNVDKAEDEPELAKKINVDGPANLAKLSSKLNIPLVHISTDYVFDGSSNSPITEDAKTNPLGVYGKTKLEGEQCVLQWSSTAMIIRTAWLFSPYGKNFVKTMLTLGQNRDTLSVVCDQVGTPTYAPHLAEVILKVLPHIKIGTKEIYNYTNEGVCSWYDFAWYILNKTGSKCKVNSILSKEYPTKAVRPAYSVLSKAKIKKDFNITIPHWIQGVNECLTKLS